ALEGVNAAAARRDCIRKGNNIARSGQLHQYARAIGLRIGNSNQASKNPKDQVGAFAPKKYRHPGSVRKAMAMVHQFRYEFLGKLPAPEFLEEPLPSLVWYSSKRPWLRNATPGFAGAHDSRFMTGLDHW